MKEVLFNTTLPIKSGTRPLTRQVPLMLYRISIPQQDTHGSVGVILALKCMHQTVLALVSGITSRPSLKLLSMTGEYCLPRKMESYVSTKPPFSGNRLGHLATVCRVQRGTSSTNYGRMGRSLQSVFLMQGYSSQNITSLSWSWMADGRPIRLERPTSRVVFHFQ